MLLVGSQGIGADQFRKLRHGVRRGIGLRLLLEKGDGETAPGQLQRAFATGKPRTDKSYSLCGHGYSGEKSSRARSGRNGKGRRETAARAGSVPLLRPLLYATLQDIRNHFNAGAPHGFHLVLPRHRRRSRWPDVYQKIFPKQPLSPPHALFREPPRKRRHLVSCA